MPSEIIDSRGMSPSPFPDEISSGDERPVGLWKTDVVHNFYGVQANGKLPTVASSPIQKRMPMDSQMVKGFELPDTFPNRGQKINPPIEKLTCGPGKAASLSLPQAFEHTLGSASYCTGGDKVNFTGASHENSLFSSSVTEIFTRKLRLISNNTLYGYSVDAPKCHEEEETFESLEELEAQTIGNLLPDDDDLFSGVTDGIDSSACPVGGDDIEELDLFSSVGGLDLGEDGSSSVPKNLGAFNGNSSSQLEGPRGATRGEYPIGEKPYRTITVRNINSNIEDSELQALFEQYGDICTMYTACKYQGFVVISYYDIRAARNAMEALQNKALRHRKLDIHYSIPKGNPSDKDINQGNLMVCNLDSSVSNDELRQIFEVFGEIKEIREAPNRNQKIVEFFDVRAAEAARCALDRSDIAGKQIIVEPSHPGDARRSMHRFSSELDQDASGFYMQQSSPPANLMLGFHGSISHGGITANMDSGTVLGACATNGLPLSPYIENAFHHGISSSVPNNLPSLLSIKSIDCHDGLTNGVLSKSPGNMASNMSMRSLELLEKPICRVSSNTHSIELNEKVLSASRNGSCLSPGHRYMWNNSHQQRPQGMIWPNSPSFVNGTHSSPRQQLHAVPKAPSPLPNGLLPMYNHHVGSAPSANPSVWERQHAYSGDSPDASVFHPGSLGSMRIPGTSPHLMESIPHGLFPRNGGSCMDLPIPSKNVQLNSHNQRCMMIPARGQMIHMMSSFDSPNERTRSRRHEGSSSNLADNKKQFELDIDRIMRGEDKRTTLMIKNIPNKYTSKMLLAAIDERHRGTYDFLYLPIDFKNKCNVGYAFINMTDPGLIVPFYHAFNGKKWEKFNSEKVATLAYARIQGKAALVAHFQNSSLMNEDKRCRPILFHSDGPNAGDQVPFPMGTNIRSRPNKNRSITTDENNQEGLPNSGKGEEPSDGSSSSVSLNNAD